MIQHTLTYVMYRYLRRGVLRVPSWFLDPAFRLLRHDTDTSTNTNTTADIRVDTIHSEKRILMNAIPTGVRLNNLKTGDIF